MRTINEQSQTVWDKAAAETLSTMSAMQFFGPGEQRMYRKMTVTPEAESPLIRLLFHRGAGIQVGIQ